MDILYPLPVLQVCFFAELVQHFQMEMPVDIQFFIFQNL